MPIAMAALDVAGQIRERNPVDLAVFGEESVRLIDRFSDRAAGEHLLARAVADGCAEAVALLATQAGPRQLRVGLWRQRGGERIRVLAAFSGAAAPAGETGLPAAVRHALGRAGHDLRSPLEAIAGFATMIRGGKDAGVAAHADDILAAAWRLMRVASDLEAAAASGAAVPPVRPAEVDLARLGRRIARLAMPAARVAGVSLETGGLTSASGPLVLADEGALWSLVDMLLQGAIRLGGTGARIVVALESTEGGAALVIAVEGAGPTTAEWRQDIGLDVESCRELALINGAELEVGPNPGPTARITFPAARCLGPL